MTVEVDPMVHDSHDVDNKVVKLSDAQKSVKDLLNFMASQGPQNFNTMELFRMKKIHDKHIKIGGTHSTLMPTKQCDIRSFFVSSDMFFLALNGTL